MKHRPNLLWLLAILALAAPPLAAQSREKLPDPEVQRECVEDAKGLRQWEKFDVTCPTCKKVKITDCRQCGGELPNCPECEGKNEAKCRACAGTGRLPDPLEEMVCIYCKGGACYRCSLCGGDGVIQVKEQDDVRCGSCKGEGFFPCSVCKEKRRLPSVLVKRKSPAKAKLKDLQEAKVVLQESLTELEAWEPNETISKNQKALAQVLTKPSRALPAVKDMQKLLETVLKGQVRAGSLYQGYEAALTHQFLVFKDRTVYLLKYQIAVLDLCIARLEHNEKILSGGK